MLKRSKTSELIKMRLWLYAMNESQVWFDTFRDSATICRTKNENNNKNEKWFFFSRKLNITNINTNHNIFDSFHFILFWHKSIFSFLQFMFQSPSPFTSEFLFLSQITIENVLRWRWRCIFYSSVDILANRSFIFKRWKSHSKKINCNEKFSQWKWFFVWCKKKY